MHPTISSRRRSQSLDVQKRPAFFSLPRQPPLLTGRRDPAKYKGIERPPFDFPPPIRERLGAAPHTKSIPTSQPVVSVSPHIAGWMEVADNVVGRHPHAKPLITRVATQAEIALISGHVHIPWAYTPVKKIQPGPVRTQKPTLSIIPSLALEDVGNTHGLPVWRAVHHNAKLFKGKSLRYARGKENIPIAPLSTCSRRG